MANKVPGIGYPAFPAYAHLYPGVRAVREACTRIAAYMDPEELRERCEELYGVPYEEALEMAYENVLSEARAVAGGES